MLCNVHKLLFCVKAFQKLIYPGRGDNFSMKNKINNNFN